ADRIIDEFARQNPNSPVVDELRFRRAEVKYQSGRLNEAHREFSEFIRSSTHAQLTGEANYYLGAIAASRGREAQAESHMRGVLEAGSGARAADSARRLGELYLTPGRSQELLDVYRRLQSIASNDQRAVADALYGQSMALLELGQG